MIRRPPRSPLFPSTTLFRSHLFQLLTMTAMEPPISFDADEVRNKQAEVLHAIQPLDPEEVLTNMVRENFLDRKSTRLNSSHLVISYAVFCLKKKKQISKELHPIDLPHYHTVGDTHLVKRHERVTHAH